MTLPRYVKRDIVKGRTYYYFRRGGKRTRLPDPYHEAGFAEAYAKCLGVPVAPADPHSLAAAVAAHRLSPEYKRLRDSSRVSRDKALERFSSGPRAALRVIAYEPHHVRAWRDKYADTPAAANRMLDDVSAFMKWAVENGYRNDNPCREISALPKGDGYEPWPLDAVRLITSEAAPWIARPVLLALHTARRQGDVLGMHSDAINGDVWKLKPEKAGTWESIKLSEHALALVRTLQAETGGGYLLRNSRGKAWTKSGFRASFRKEMARLGLDKHEPRLVFHGLRTTAATHMREGGASVNELQAALGHASARMASHYARRADRTEDGAKATARLPDYGKTD